MKYTLGIIGGTGKEGSGLAYRWAMAGHKVIIGSRQVEKALTAVEILREKIGEQEVDLSGTSNPEAVKACDIAVLTVPFAAHAATLEVLKEELQGKLLIDVSVPLVPPKVTKVQMPPEGSAALQAKAILGPDVQVVDAFQTVSFERLLSGEEIDCDVLVAGGNKESREIVIGLAEDMGLNAWDAGVIENTVVVEGLTSILIGLNIKYKVDSAGVRITGIK
ncbi:MAG: NADPH-dependent F420 reductase [Anaerolineaceae bacterium]|jgi:NADPH-dependent F420 reductase|nr:NADPH-dependent F420 reductase [Anaerolineaceae bacterium]